MSNQLDLVKAIFPDSEYELDEDRNVIGLYLNRSMLKKLPPEIGQLTSLKQFWKKFKEEMPPPKTFGLYLLWNEDDGEGTLRSVHPQTAYHLSFPIWASQYTHWAFFKKKTKRDHYI